MFKLTLNHSYVHIGMLVRLVWCCWPSTNKILRKSNTYQDFLLKNSCFTIFVGWPRTTNWLLIWHLNRMSTHKLGLQWVTKYLERKNRKSKLFIGICLSQVNAMMAKNQKEFMTNSVGKISVYIFLFVIHKY